MIEHLQHEAIDKAAWDARLDRSANALWYAHSSVLDAACPGWEALVDRERDAQMPLTKGRKFGIEYLYQPFLLQQLGVFGAAPSPGLTGEFLSAIPRKFKLAEIMLQAPRVSGAPTDMEFTERSNLVLDLSATLEVLRAGYHTGHRRNLKRTEEAAAGYADDITAEAFIAFIEGAPQFQQWRLRPAQKMAFRAVVRVAMAQGGMVHGVRSNGILVAALLIMPWKDRLIHLKGLALEEGRRSNAMIHLFDRIIEHHAGTPRLLDMAGSMDPSLARFYAGFGAQPCVYLHARAQRLPVLLKWLKA